MKIGIISDTHSVLDQKVIEFLAGCDEIWHAGDVGNSDIISDLESIAPTKGVYGNIDGHDVRISYPEHLLFSIGTQRILLTHIAGNPPRYNKRVKFLINRHRPTILVCGHSHILKVVHDKTNKLLFINPGALGNQGYHQVKTAIRFQINEDKPEKMEVLQYERHKKRPLNKSLS